MPFETLVLFKLALPPPILVEVIYRLEAARIAVFEERQECFAPPPSIELEGGAGGAREAYLQVPYIWGGEAAEG
nr:MAG: hypothetical protein TU35_09505 [Thermoproteus sp. AZ2]